MIKTFGGSLATSKASRLGLLRTTGRVHGGAGLCSMLKPWAVMPIVGMIESGKNEQNVFLAQEEVIGNTASSPEVLLKLIKIH